MKSILPLVALLVALPASAQERFDLGLTYDNAQGKSQTLDPVSFEPKDNSGLGLTFAWSPWNVGDAQLGLTAAYRFKGTSDLVMSGPGLSDASVNYRYEHADVGGRCLWRKPFDFGFGLQYRFEKVAVDPKGPGNSVSGNVTRPWIDAMAGYTFQASGAVKPFVALTVAAPLTSESKPTSIPVNDAQAQANQEQFVKSLAPRFEVALTVGMRF